MLVNKILSNILLNSLILYILIKYLKIWISVSQLTNLNCEIIFILGFLFWVIYDISTKIIKLLTLPLSWLLGPIFAIFLNIVAIYLFVYIVNNLQIWITLHVISLTGALVVSIIVAVLNLVFKKL